MTNNVLATREVSLTVTRQNYSRGNRIQNPA